MEYRNEINREQERILEIIKTIESSFIRYRLIPEFEIGKINFKKCPPDPKDSGWYLVKDYNGNVGFAFYNPRDLSWSIRGTEDNMSEICVCQYFDYKVSDLKK